MEDTDESLPFDVEVERLPPWAQAASALVVVSGALIAARVLPMFSLLPFLVASSAGRRFASAATHAEVSADGLELGGREIPRGAIVDVWIDDQEPRAVVAYGEEITLAVLHFENALQARRFRDALGATTTHVVGHRPRPIDLLGPLRFVAIAVAFLATGSVYGLLVLVFFALGAWTLLQAKQVVLYDDRVEVRTLLGVQVHRIEDVASVDVDGGSFTLKGDREIRLPRGSLRDTTLASAEWLERARGRVLARMEARRAEAAEAPALPGV